MLLSNSLITTLFASRGLFARADVVTTIVTTLVEESTTYIVVGPQTEETVVRGHPSVVEVTGFTDALEFPPSVAHTQAGETTVSIEIAPQPLRNNSEFTGRFNGNPFTELVPFFTTWTYPSTTLSLSFPARQTAFVFTGEATTEITLPSEHTHIIIDGVETTVDIPGFTTTLAVSGSTNVIVRLPAVTTAMEIGAETYGFTVTADLVEGDGDSRFCGTDDAQILTDHSQTGICDQCVAGTTFVVTFPTSTKNLYLYMPRFTTSFGLPGTTVTLVPEQTITITKEGSTKASIVPAVVSAFVTTITSADACASQATSATVTLVVTEPGTTIPGTTIPGTTILGTEYTTTRAC